MIIVSSPPSTEMRQMERRLSQAVPPLPDVPPKLQPYVRAAGLSPDQRLRSNLRKVRKTPGRFLTHLFSTKKKVQNVSLRETYDGPPELGGKIVASLQPGSDRFGRPIMDDHGLAVATATEDERERRRTAPPPTTAKDVAAAAANQGLQLTTQKTQEGLDKLNTLKSALKKTPDGAFQKLKKATSVSPDKRRESTKTTADVIGGFFGKYSAPGTKRRKSARKVSIGNVVEVLDAKPPVLHSPQYEVVEKVDERTGKMIGYESKRAAEFRNRNLSRSPRGGSPPRSSSSLSPSRGRARSAVDAFAEQSSSSGRLFSGEDSSSAAPAKKKSMKLRLKNDREQRNLVLEEARASGQTDSRQLRALSSAAMLAGGERPSADPRGANALELAKANMMANMQQMEAATQLSRLRASKSGALTEADSERRERVRQTGRDGLERMWTAGE